MAQASPVEGQDVVHFEVDRLVKERLKSEASGPFIRHLRGLLGERARMGQAKYGTPLMTWNGRSAVQDSWEEAVDLVYYLTQKVIELRTVGTPLERMFFRRLRDEAFTLMSSLTTILPGVPE